MAVVLVHPPAVAQPDAQVAEQDAGHVAGPPGAENLPVPGVMAQEPAPGEHHPPEHRPPRPPPQPPGRPALPGQLRILAAARRRRRCGGQLDLPGHGSCRFGGPHRELRSPASRDTPGRVSLSAVRPAAGATRWPGSSGPARTGRIRPSAAAPPSGASLALWSLTTPGASPPRPAPPTGPDTR